MKIKIGLESHVQLNSKSKLFCGCVNPVNTKAEIAPNSLCCDTCLGFPGTKPRANKAIIEMATKVAIALSCNIAEEMFFSRKTYFYPDMNKNFQITQYEVPLAVSGFLEILADEGKAKKIRIRRLHIEEDPAKLVHVGGLGGEESRYVLVDYNRAGIPLIEIVTEPDFSSAAEARRYLAKLIAILEYLKVYSAESEAVVKTDANISIEGGEKVEVKNITGTTEIEKALNYEIIRQNNELRKGNKIVQETRGWDPARSATIAMRLKEEEAEYGYIFEPDLTKIEITKSLLEKLKKEIPELPDEKKSRFVKQYKISETLADGLVSDLNIANLFESASKKINKQIAASWIAGPLLKTLNWHNLRFSSAGVKEEWIIDLLKKFETGKLTKVQAEQLLRTMIETKKYVYTEELTETIKVADELETIVKKVIIDNPKAIADFRGGKQKALEFLVGQIMREAKGAADAKSARDIILRVLKKT